MNSWLLIPLLFCAGEKPSSPVVDFESEVIPTLTRLGCNSGACHGTPSGKNGFRLSLRGYDNTLDRDSLTRENSSRRINTNDPEQSLLLLKGIAAVPHEGGKLMEMSSPEYQLLVRWLRQGAPLQQNPSTVPIFITPDSGTISNFEQHPAFRVFTQEKNGTKKEVTHLARFSVSDEEQARITRDGRLTLLKKGEAIVIAEYRSQVAIAKTLFAGNAKPNLGSDHAIDRLAQKRLQELGLANAPVADDATFLRRATLQIIGKVPTPSEVRSFLKNTSPRKRVAWIEDLLERSEFADWWALKWSDRLGCNQRFVGKIGAHKYYQWIHSAMASNVPEDQFTRDILTSLGGNYSNPPAGFWRRLRDPTLRAEETSQLFLGVRINCAKCHNHPQERWTQEDYHAFSAFFAKLAYKDGPFFVQLYDKEETILLDRSGSWKNPRTSNPAAPKFLGGATPTIQPYADPREEFARWVTAPDNPFFARAAVNRIWYHLFGRGIVDPVDDLRVTNPPSHPELLEHLADQFIRMGYDRKKMIRYIATSKVFQLESSPQNQELDEERYLARYPMQRLGAEALLDAVASATQSPVRFTGYPMGTGAALLPDGEFKQPFLESFGRPPRAMACECERASDVSMTQAIHLMSANLFQDLISSPNGRVQNLIAAKASNPQVIEELFLACLGRFPTDAENKQSLKYLENQSTEKRKESIEDLMFALVNHREFLFRH